MKTIGKVLALIVGSYDLMITMMVAYNYWGITGVIIAILVPISMLIAPIIVFIDSANPVPFVVILVGSIVSWLLIRDWRTSPNNKAGTRIERSEDGTYLLQIRKPMEKQPIRFSGRATSINDVKHRLTLAMQYSDANAYERDFKNYNEIDINSLSIEKLYAYAAARMHFVIDVCTGDIMLFGDVPGSGASITVLEEFNKWHNRLFRAEQGLKPISKETNQPVQKTQPEFNTEFAKMIEDLSRLKDNGAISEQEYQKKKTEILSRV